ncbi:hypothetical protein TNCV_1921231 [Trichonephila clavipes]|nr:hypothetical protein TNCV_1921231 [Trichonephila clavipes]
MRSSSNIHWCPKIKDEVEKLAYQLNEEAERTERPIRRLSKVMYGSTCADMHFIDSLNINVALFSYTRAFGDGPRNFEPWSSDVDDT